MSIELSKNLAGIIVGNTVTLDFRNQTTGIYIPPTAKQVAENVLPQLLLWNESGCGFDIVLPNRPPTKFLPAGGWRKVTLPSDAQSLTLICTYLIANAPVSVLKAEWYQAGEPIDDVGFLGNSPIGLSGSVPTSVTQVIQDGQPTGQIIVESTPTGLTQTIADTTDGVRQAKGKTASYVVVPDTTLANQTVFRAGVDAHSGSDWMLISLSTGDITLWDNINSRNIWIAKKADGSIQVPQFVSSLGGQATVGSFGVPSIVGQALAVSVGVTTQVTLLSFSVPATGFYRVNVHISASNGVASSAIACTVNYIDPHLGPAQTASIIVPSGNTGVTLNGVNTFNASGGLALAGSSAAIAMQSSSTTTVTYRDPSGTPNDVVNVLIERLA